MKTVLISSGAVLTLVATGCMSGMYSSDFSVSEKKDGIKSYSVVQSLSKDEYPTTMPVTVKYTSSPIQENKHLGADALYLFSFGLIPGFTSQSIAYDVTVRTPLGEQSGNCTVYAKRWMGWLPLFLPYPGLADERDGLAKLPNPDFESKVRDKLIANLVSQFPNAEYERRAAEWNSPQARERRIKEAEEKAKAEQARREKQAREAQARREKQEEERKRLLEEERKRQAEEARKADERAIFAPCSRAEWVRVKACQEFAALRDCYSRERERRWECPFPRKDKERDRRIDWLKTWTGPRLELSEADKLAGESLLAEFGSKFMPNAYARFEKARDEAVALQQVVNEEFPNPWAIKPGDTRWSAFSKVLEKFSQVRTEYFLCHDERCFYWLLNKLGLCDVASLAKYDAQENPSRLLQENYSCLEYEILPVTQMEGNVGEFAAKYAPESFSAYQKMEQEYRTAHALLKEVLEQRRLMDDVRLSLAMTALVDKINDLARELNVLTDALQSWRLEHRTMVLSSEDVAARDAKTASLLKPLVEAMPTYIAAKMRGFRIIPDVDMIAIPWKSYRMQRTEVTLFQWMAVMGKEKPRWLEYWKLNWPFAFFVNSMRDSIQRWREFKQALDSTSGRGHYRLPTEEEWTYACRAGSTGDWGKRRNGEEGSSALVRGRDSHPHVVASRECNAFGLFDMHGNVWELCSSGRLLGGSHRQDAEMCTASCAVWPGTGGGGVGIRLVMEK